MYVSVDVDVDEILEDLTDDEVQELYDERFATSTSSGSGFWKGLYEDRMRMTKEDFLKHIDKLIMDHSGRIICD